MTNGPRENIIHHPRFERVFQKALRKQGLPEMLGDSVRRLVQGTADPRSFVCCNSGCVPCVKDYLRAAEEVLKELPEEAPPRRRFWPFGRKTI